LALGEPDQKFELDDPRTWGKKRNRLFPPAIHPQGRTAGSAMPKGGGEAMQVVGQSRGQLG
jgi:hypothetical protein